MLVFRIIAGILFGIWLLLVLLGKGGFAHILLLCAIGVASVDWGCFHRGRMIAR